MQENKEKKKENDLEALTYALFRCLNEFKNALNEYENNPNPEENFPQNELWNNISGTMMEVTSKYDISFDSLINTLPPEYRPLAKVVKRMRVDQVIDIVSDIAKEYVREEDGSYRSLEETLTRVMGKQLLKKVFGR
mgnify:CR=1 FL=1